MGEISDIIQGKNTESPKGIFSRKQVIDIIDMLLRCPTALTDAVDNINTTWDAESLLKLAEGELPDSINEKWKKIVEANQDEK